MHGNKNTHGAVSVFLVIILVPCIVVSSMFVDLGKVYLGKSLANSAGELALNTVMTNYDYDLNDYYGLVASCQNIEEFYEISAQYYLDILNSHKLSEEDMTTLADYYAYLTRDDTIYDLLQIECQTAPSAMITTVEDGNLSNPALIKGQIVEFMKYRAPIELLESTGILNGLAAVSDDLEDSEADKKLLEDKREFFEAENKLLEKAFNIYKDIEAYKALGATQDKVESMANRMNTYKGKYEQFHEALVKDLYNTAGLRVKSRTVYDINFYQCNTYYNNGGGDEHLAEISDVKALIENLAKAITSFITSKESLESQFPSYSQGSADGNTYDIQWWVQCNNISLDDFNRKAEELLQAYNALDNAVNYMSADAVTAYNNSGGNFTVTGNDKSKYNGFNSNLSLQSHVNELWNQVRGSSGLYSVYLAQLVKDENNGDAFIKNMSIIERISTSAENQKAIDSSRHVINASGVSASQTISDIYTEINQDRSDLVSYRDALENIINQMDDLNTLVRKYKEKFGNWDETSQATDTTLGNADEDEINGEGDYAGQRSIRDTLNDVTEDSVNELKTRLTNMKELFDTLISAIDNMKYGSKAVKDIENYEAAKGASGVSSSKIKQTNGELNSYVNESFKFTMQNNAYVNIIITVSNNPNIEIEPRPALYVWMKNKQWSDKTKEEVETEKDKYEDKKKEADKDLSQQTVPSESSKDIRKDYEGSSDEFPSGLSMSALSGGDMLSGIVHLAKDLFSDFDSALSGMRDNLYATEYMFGNFSFHTFEKEGKYKTAKKLVKEGKLSKDLNKLTPAEANLFYNDTTLCSEWSREDATFWNNKSLTNKMINAVNNYAYGSEIEYILYGGKNDDNISKAYSSIYTIRYVLNLPSGFLTFYPTQTPSGSAEICITHAAIHAASAGISAATLGIVPEPLARIVLILIEVAAESVCDIEYLKAGLPVKLVKGKSDKNWGLKKEIESTGIYFSYKDYLYMFTILGFNSGDKEACMYARIGDVIQANMRHIIGSAGSSYRLAKSVVYFQFQATLRVKPLMLALPIANGYENNPKNSTDWCTFTYKIIRGYT